MIEKHIQSESQSQIEEQSLIEKCKYDPRHFKALYEQYFKRIFVFVLHRTGEKSTAADITSQVFLKALVNIKGYTSRGLPFSAWLFRIALNECLDHFRKTKRYRVVTIDDDVMNQLHDEIIADYGAADLQQKLPMILQQLPTQELHIIELRYFEKRSFREVGDILGITETYAKVRVYRILDKMKKLFFRQT